MRRDVGQDAFHRHLVAFEQREQRLFRIVGVDIRIDQMPQRCS
jgi:hypothetical protein